MDSGDESGEDYKNSCKKKKSGWRQEASAQLCVTIMRDALWAQFFLPERNDTDHWSSHLSVHTALTCPEGQGLATCSHHAEGSCLGLPVQASSHLA